ncbi:cytochrome c551 [Roseobacter denitrificans]|uniref:Cytochrome c-551 n=1 Tax=Roseobacter denitrificans (strain ATCC 33942 / OCh 114) TaxID=375451 RepID=CY551_ROSDO|nr:cytochrome c551 [Roseobacter denitrificans]P07625.2 RecName: Full=Cytochrome c-551; AltName: Full=Cytochrome c551; Flags: Precursor [Roseobacter denitrificans OCh 114]ABG29861.1 cytochrome c-551 [Roseobacter denitrificans OCh 114]AVL53077.1 cytochrome c551 [Roseobacter denitrificans]SFG25659.1 cytochrome c [Roseobacter denitrificans OCh 114]
MTRTLAVVLAMTFSAAPVFAEGDIEAGEKAFNKCKSCHQIVSDAGEEIVKGGRTGPNLYGVLGRQAGTADFRYGDDLVAAGEAGLVWDADNFVEYVTDPRAFLRAYLDDSKAKSKMAYKLRSGGEDIAAYLASVSGSSS